MTGNNPDSELRELLRGDFDLPEGTQPTTPENRWNELLVWIQAMQNPSNATMRDLITPLPHANRFTVDDRPRNPRCGSRLK